MTGNGRVSHAEIIVVVRVLCPDLALMDHIPSEYLAGVATGSEHLSLDKVHMELVIRSVLTH